MSPLPNRRHLRRSEPMVPVLSLLLGLCLQPLSSNADVAPTLNSQAAQANQASAPASVAPQRTTAPVTTETKPQSTVKTTPKSTLAEAAAVTPPRKQVRPPKRKAQPDVRMRQALEQVADERAAEKRAEKIRDLLARAQLDYTEGRVFEPNDDNAAARYREVLTLDPAQPQALAASQRIADILVSEAQHVALAGDAPRTLQYLLQIRALQPKHPALQGLEARYRALLANPVVLSTRQQERYRGSAERIDDAYAVLKNQPASKQTMDRVISRYDRAKQLVTEAPGLPKLEDRIIIAFPSAVRAELAADEPRRAYSLVQTARKRGWLTDELSALEEQAKQDIRAKQLFSDP